MFEYNICNQADADLFRKQCQALKNRIPALEEMGLLTDVDGTLTQRYSSEIGTIMVKNDMQVDALYIISDFDLLPYFQNT